MIKERNGDKALRICDKCGHEQWVNYWNIYRKGVHICRSCSCKEMVKTRKSNPWNKGVKQAPRNVGNTYINTSGYSEVWVGKHTDTTTKGGYQKEHRVLTEVDIGRRLTSDELIHHVDGNKINNSVNNLAICAGDFEHRKIHGQLERIAFQLVRNRLISFNHDTKQYYLNIDVKDCKLIDETEDVQPRSFEMMTVDERVALIDNWSVLVKES